VTKLDGSAKGGIVVAIAEKMGIPVRYIGIGEASEDLQPFKATDYAEALLGGSAGRDDPGANAT
jgi:fused signal recognition particle receptor